MFNEPMVNFRNQFIIWSTTNRFDFEILLILFAISRDRNRNREKKSILNFLFIYSVQYICK